MLGVQRANCEGRDVLNQIENKWRNSKILYCITDNFYARTSAHH